MSILDDYKKIKTNLGATTATTKRATTSNRANIGLGSVALGGYTSGDTIKQSTTNTTGTTNKNGISNGLSVITPVVKQKLGKPSDYDSIEEYLKASQLYNQSIIEDNYSLANGLNSNASTQQQEQSYFDYITAQNNLNASESALAQYLALQQAQGQGMAEQDVARQQTEKYLSEQLKASGLGNVGASESSRIGIGNTYARNISDINTEATSVENNILASYQDAINQNDSENATNKLNSVKEYQDAIYIDAWNNLETFDNDKQMDEFLNAIKDKVSKSQYEMLVGRANAIKTNTARNLAIKNNTDLLESSDDTISAKTMEDYMVILEQLKNETNASVIGATQIANALNLDIEKDKELITQLFRAINNYD